mgnify:CR=1 FL=1
MDPLDTIRAALAGLEFDWLLADDEGRLALCETAGYGEVPDAVLALGEDALSGAYATSVSEILTALPERGGCTQEHHGVGTDLVTLGYATRGLYVFDWCHWSGPHRRIVIPGSPIAMHELPPSLRTLVSLSPPAPLQFAKTTELQLADLMPCRRTGAG